jgi:hypothetical protein
VFSDDETTQAADYVALGPGTDPSAATDPGEVAYDPMQADSGCPAGAFFPRRAGAYNPGRLDDVGGDAGCRTIRGTVKEKGRSGDGHQTFNFDPSTIVVDQTVRLRGREIFDSNHKGVDCTGNPACTTSGIRELHPRARGGRERQRGVRDLRRVVAATRRPRSRTPAVRRSGR